MNQTIKLPNNIIVNSFNIIGTNIKVYEAFEPSSYMGNHSQIQTFDGHVYGHIPSRRKGEPYKNENDAIQYILNAYPHLERIQTEISFTYDNGRIETYNEQESECNAKI